MNTRYDVLLGMPWHVANNPKVDYKRRIVKVNEEILSLADPEEEPEVGTTTITNISVKKFRRLLKKSHQKSRYFRSLQIFLMS